MRNENEYVLPKKKKNRTEQKHKNEIEKKSFLDVCVNNLLTLILFLISTLICSHWLGPFFFSGKLWFLIDEYAESSESIEFWANMPYGPSAKSYIKTKTLALHKLLTIFYIFTFNIMKLRHLYSFFCTRLNIKTIRFACLFD